MKVEVGKHQLPEERYVRSLARYGNTLWQHRSYVAGGILIFLLSGVGLILVLHHRAERSDRAWPAAATMNSADDVSYVEELAMGTDAEPFFIMEAGTLLFERGKRKDLEKAEELYRRFCTRWRRHPGAPYAKQSLGCVLEQQNKYEEAMKEFAALAQVDGPLAAQSLWDAGRCAEKAGKVDLARGFYMRLTAMEDASPWTKYAGARLAEILSGKEKKTGPKETTRPQDETESKEKTEPEKKPEPEKETEHEKKEEKDG
jgi:tetratricopeptide (TPR) repeat protein